MTASLTNMTTLGSIRNEESSKDAQLFQMALPASDSNQAIALDLFGVNRTITIDGVFVDGTSSLTIAQFIAELDALVNGQQSSRSYVSSKSGSTYTVLIQMVKWKAGEGEVNHVNYTISMMESMAI